MICSKCTTINRDTARFCNNCGASLAQPAAEPAEPSLQAERLAAEFDVLQVSMEELGSPDADMSTSGDDIVPTDAQIEQLDTQMELPQQVDNMVDLVDAAAEQILSVVNPSDNDRTTAMSPSIAGTINEQDSPSPDQGEIIASAIDTEPAPSSYTYSDSTTMDSQITSADEMFTDDSEAQTLPRLGAQDWVAMRFEIVSDNTSAEGDSTYSATDWGNCPTCHELIICNEGETPQQRIAKEPYCDSCGSDLRSAELHWPMVTLQEVASESDIIDQSRIIRDEDRFFVITVIEPMSENRPDNGFAAGVSLLAAQRSHVGILRAGRPDEDSCFCFTFSSIHDSVAGLTVGVYIVADGMGGQGDGEIASRIAVETIAPLLMQRIALPILQNESLDAESVIQQIREAVQAANQSILDEARVRSNDMGTTVTLAVVINTQVFVANVGDSRTYLRGKEGMQRITNDHSVVFNLMKAGQLTENDLYDHPRRSEIFRSLGFQPRVEVDQFQASLSPGDVLLLCCDGLWEMLRTEGIEDVLMLNFSDPQAICDFLVRRANDAGGEDNISVIVVRAVA